MSAVEQAEPATIKKWLDNGEAVLIDVREDPEIAAARIPGAEHIAMSRFDPSQIPALEGRRLVLHCAHGMRSDTVARELVGRGLYDDVVNMTGGIAAWHHEGFPIEG